MKLKYFTLASSLFFCCHLATGATYNLSDDQLFNSSDLLVDPGSSPYNEAVNPGFLGSQTSSKEQVEQEYHAVVALINNRQFNEAENKLDRLIQQNPAGSDFFNLRALVQTLKGNNSLAINSYQKALQLNPKNPRSHLGLASVFFQTEEFGQAKKSANSSLSINDKAGRAYIILAEIAYREKRLQDVESILLKAQKKLRGDKQQEIIIINNLAKFYAIQKQPKKMLDLARDTLHRYQGDSSALALLASAQLYNKKTALAISTLEKLISQEKSDIQHRFLLAKLLLQQPQKKKQVLKLLNEIKAIAPKNAQVQANRAVFLAQIGYYPDALQAAKKVKQLAPDTGLAEALEGEIYLAEKKQKLALTAFQKSYKIESNSKVLGVIVNLMVSQDKQSDAINFLSQEVQKNPKNLAAHLSLASLYHQQNNTLEAKKHYQVILAEQPDNVVILNNLAWIYHLENNPKALKLAKLAYQKAPKSADIADTYAVILARQGELTKAIKVLQKASQMAPEKYDIQYHLADAYAKKGQNRQAIDILKTITQSKQDFSEKQAAVSLLKKLN